MNLVRRAIDWFVWETVREIQQEQQEHAKSARAIRAASVVLVCAAVILVFREAQYRPSLVDILNWLFPESAAADSWRANARIWLYDDRNWELTQLMYWSLWQAVVYLLIPIAVIKLVLREPLRDYGVKLKGATHGWWAYAGMYLAILPFVLLMSHRASFQATYPFLEPAAVDGVLNDAYWKRFLVWQCFYALQFVSLEFFFRGFMVHGTRRVFGIGSIYVMTIPYCMIHFGKPLPETLGAIIAGLVLGFMSLKTRSIWLGCASHMAVALTMDFSALTVWSQTVR